MPRFSAATFACLTTLLVAAPGAFAASNITVVPGATNANVSAGPSFTPTAADAQVGADNINGFLAAGTDVTLNTAPDFSQAGTITVNGAIASAHADGDLTLNADDDISQGAVSIAVAGNVHVETDVNHDITLDGVTNNFNTVSSPSSATLSLRDQNALVLRSISTNVNLELEAGGNVTQVPATQLATNHVLLALGSNDATLINPENEVSGFNAASVGDLNISTSTGNLQARGTVSGNLTAAAPGTLFDNEPVSVTGMAVLSGNAITLDNPANDFSTVGVAGLSNVTLVDAGGLVLGPCIVGGALTAIASGGGALGQTGPLAVDGATAASGSPVTLDDADNDFVGAVGITSSGGGAATVEDTNDLTLGSSTSGGSLTATADGDLTIPGAATIAATGALRIVADNANPAAPAIGAGGITVGANAALTGAGAIRLYGSRRGDNSVAGSATFNGSIFTSGTIFVNSVRERWGVYSPAGTATAPFTFFYKDTDTSTPQATITAPANGATYERGQVVNAAYSCSDGGGGSGVTSCAGTVANGSPIDTSATGQKTFTVDVVSGSGRQGTSTVTYNVVDPPDPDPSPDPAPSPDPVVEVIGVERDRESGTATLTVSTNLPGTLHVEKTNKVKGFGPIELDQAGEGELEVVARGKAAKALERTGRVTVNPRVKFAATGLGYEIGVRHEFELRLD